MSRELTKKDINPIVAKMSYKEIESIFGVQAAHVAKVMGVKKTSKKKKETDSEGDK